MYDVELVLRYFSMRHIDNFSGKLSLFMDLCLRQGNQYTSEQLQLLSNTFEKAIKMADNFFAEKALCQYTIIRGKYAWTSPQKMIYDPLMLALSQLDSCPQQMNIDNNIEYLQSFYCKYSDAFDGKKQGKSDIKNRTELFHELLKEIILQQS